jgi:ankyrin repeat protein
MRIPFHYIQHYRGLPTPIVGADVNGNGYDDSPLTGAANNGHIDVVRYLVSQGANVNRNS